MSKCEKCSNGCVSECDCSCHNEKKYFCPECKSEKLEAASRQLSDVACFGMNLYYCHDCPCTFGIMRRE